MTSVNESYPLSLKSPKARRNSPTSTFRRCTSLSTEMGDELVLELFKAFEIEPFGERPLAAPPEIPGSPVLSCSSNRKCSLTELISWSARLPRITGTSHPGKGQAIGTRGQTSRCASISPRGNDASWSAADNCTAGPFGVKQLFGHGMRTAEQEARWSSLPSLATASFPHAPQISFTPHVCPWQARAFAVIPTPHAGHFTGRKSQDSLSWASSAETGAFHTQPRRAGIGEAVSRAWTQRTMRRSAPRATRCESFRADSVSGVSSTGHVFADARCAAMQAWQKTCSAVHWQRAGEAAETVMRSHRAHACSSSSSFSRARATGKEVMKRVRGMAGEDGGWTCG